MRHYIYNMLSAAVLLVAAVACVKEKASDEQTMNERKAAMAQLEVSYSSGGQAVSEITVGSSASRYELEVKMNNDNLRWNLESDRAWCVVVPGEHRGSGKVVLSIEANESFDARDMASAATLSFVAGEYRSEAITVSQIGTKFIVNKPYFIAPMDGGVYTTRVTTPAGTSWNCEGNEWMEVTRGATTSGAEYDTTDITIKPSYNGGESRYGTITLSSGEEASGINLWQFGSEYDYDAEGNIFFNYGVPANFSITAPAYSVKKINVPEFGKASLVENGDGTSTINFTLSDNLSDCSEVREVNLSIDLNNASAITVPLPRLMQDYTPAFGLVSAKGLKAFAQAVANGDETTDWERDGAVVVIQDISMDDVTDWPGIGTQEHPFTGTFNGKGHVITGLSGSRGLFNNIKNATVKDVALGKQGKAVSIFDNRSYTEDAVVGGLVANAQASTISGCSFVGDFEVAVTLSSGSIYAGGIVGKADASSSIEACKVGGQITITSPAASGVICNAGGIAGLCQGSILGSEMQGGLKYSSGIATAFIGGIQGKLGDGISVGNNTFNGSIILGGGVQEACVGGLYGCVENSRAFNYAQDKSMSMGSIRVNSYSSSDNTNLWVGGMVGKAKAGIGLSFAGYENKTGILLNQTAGLTSRYICIGGILGGCDWQNGSAGAVASLDIENATNSGAIMVRYSTNGSKVRHGLFGGIVGLVNGPANIKNCTNSANVGSADTSKDEDDVAGNTRAGAAANDFCEIIGGIVGYAKGGNQLIEGCANLAPVQNLHYSNRPSTSSSDGMFCSQVAGGIIGAFNYDTTPNDNITLTLKSCNNNVNGDVLCFRGYAGGIVGYCRSATITGCSSRGGQAAKENDNAYYRGGIAGGVIKTSITDCWANCNITSGAGGSAEAAFSGGIVGWVLTNDPVTIKDCKYFGKITCTPNGSKPIYPGGIVSAAAENTSVINCRFGGTVQDTEISANNVRTPAYVAGNYIANPVCSIEGIDYWDGKL